MGSKETRTEKGFPIFFEKSAVRDDEMWFVSQNMLCKMKIGSWEIEPVTFIRDDLYGIWLHDYSLNLVYKNRLIFTPEYADNLLEYDVVTGERREITIETPEIDSSLRNGGPSFKFKETLLIGDSAWFIPCSSKRIIRYNLKTFEVTCFTDWFTKNFDDSTWKDGPYFWGGIEARGRIWFVCKMTGELCEFDYEKGNLYKHNVVEGIIDPGNFFPSKNGFYFIDVINKQIFEWIDGKIEVMMKEQDFPDKYGIDNQYEAYLDKFTSSGYISSVVKYAGKFIAISHLGNMFLAIDIKQRTISNILDKPLGQFSYATVLPDGRLFCCNQAEPTSVVFDNNLNYKYVETSIRDTKNLTKANALTFFKEIHNKNDESLLMHEDELHMLNPYIYAITKERIVGFKTYRK